LYGGWGAGADRDEVANRLSRLIARLPAACADLRGEDVLANLLPPERRLAEIAPGSRFQKTPHSRVETEPGSAARSYPYEVVQIRLSDPNYGERASTRLEVAPEAAAVFRWIAASRAAFSAAELAQSFPAFPFALHRQLLEAAARAGLIRMLWFPQLAASAGG
jgi:hypothetical protein